MIRSWPTPRLWPLPNRPMLPLHHLLDEYPRTLRDLAHELGKRVEVRIDGADNRIDRAVLERLPFFNVAGQAYKYNQEQTLPG